MTLYTLRTPDGATIELATRTPEEQVQQGEKLLAQLGRGSHGVNKTEVQSGVHTATHTTHCAANSCHRSNLTADALDCCWAVLCCVAV